MKKIFLVLVAVFNLSFLVSAQQTAESTPEIRQKTFDVVWRTVNENYFDPNFGGVDWKKVHDDYAPLVAQVKTDAEFYALLDKMLGELKISHFGFIKTEEITKLKKPVATTGIRLREIENKIVVTRILKNSSAAQAGLKTGIVVEKIDDAPIENLDDAVRKLSGAPDTMVKISYLDEKDVLREVTLKRVGLSDTDKGEFGKGISIYALLESERLKNNIGYIRFSSFIEFLRPRILAAIESMKDAPGIIIDLRGNEGGDDEIGIAMANALFTEKTQLMVTKTRKGDDFYYKTKANKNAYTGKVVILTDELSGSASEQFAAGMQETGRAFVIGKTTAGEDMDADVKKLPNGAYLIYPAGQPRTPKGVVIEGRGVIPNLEISLTRASLLSGKDAQIEAAIEYITNMRP